jgi:hypothetical protein
VPKRGTINRKSLTELASKMQALCALISTGDWEPAIDLDSDPCGGVIVSAKHKHTELTTGTIVPTAMVDSLFENDNEMTSKYRKLMNFRERVDRNITRLFYELLSQIRHNDNWNAQHDK